MVKSAKMPGKTVHKATTTSTPGMGHNGPDADTFRFHVGRIIKADLAVAAVKKTLKAARRDAQDAGINLYDLDEAIAMRDQEPETVQETIRRKAQYATWMGLAPGVQADLFTSAQPVDELKAAENEGYVDGVEGVTAKGDRYDSANPIGQARLRGHAKGQKVHHKQLEQLAEARKAKAKTERAKTRAKKVSAEEDTDEDATDE